MRQLSCQITIIGEQQNAGGVTVQTTYRIDALVASITHDVDHRVTLLRIIGRGDSILRLIEQDIHFTFATNGLTMETNIIRRQHFHAQIIYRHTIDGDHSCLNEIICLTTGTNTCVGKVFIETNRLGRIFVLLTISLLLAVRINTIVTFRSTSE